MVKAWAAALAGLALGAGPAQAAIYFEDGNATRFFNGAVAPQDVGPGIDQIRGAISGGDNGDLFRLEFDIGGDLVIRARATSGALTPAVFLFDALGHGLLADAGVNNAVMGLTIVPGIYYLGFGDVPVQAVGSGASWQVTGVPTGPPADFGTLDFLDNTAPAVSPGNYRIFLSIATAGTPVPEPATVSLLALGAIGLGAASLRRRAASPAASRPCRR